MNHTLETHEGSLHYSVKGVGPPILLLAGGPGMDADYLVAIRENLSTNHQVVTIHQRGTKEISPLSLNPENINIKTYLNDIENIRQHLEIAEWIILGHSWGGMLASAYCAKYGQRVGKLILINSAGLTFEAFTFLTDNIVQRLSGNEYIKAVEIAPKLLTAEGADYATEFFKIVTPAYFYDKQVSKEFAAKLDDSFLNFAVFGLIMQDVMTSQLDLKSAASSFEKPVFHIVSRQDIVGFQAYIDIATSYPNVKVNVVEKAGHYCWMEQSEQFFESLHSFLKQ